MPFVWCVPSEYKRLSRCFLLKLSPAAYGLFAGSSIHEVAQVVAAGRAIGEQAANTAVIAKMVRVMMLAPFLMALSAYFSRARKAVATPGRSVVPWFAFGFVAMAGFNSLGLLPTAVTGTLIDIDTALLAIAMAGPGLTTDIAAIRTAGVKPLLLGAILSAWLMGGGLLINTLVSAWLS